MLTKKTARYRSVFPVRIIEKKRILISASVEKNGMARRGSLGIPPPPKNINKERSSMGIEQRTAFPVLICSPEAVDSLFEVKMAILRKS